MLAGGQARILSAPGGGTTILVRVPTTAPATERNAAEAP